MEGTKRYTAPEQEGHGDTVEEPIATYKSQVPVLDRLRHQVIDAVILSEDRATLFLCLDMLTNTRKRIHRGLSDEELAAKLSQFPDWDKTPHADLSQIDYSRYKPYRSQKVLKSIEKWL